MNKIKYLIGLAITGIIAISIPVSTVLVTSVGLSSCKDSCDTCIDIPVVPIPILTINPPQATVFDVSWGENVDFHIEAKSNIKSNKDLRDVKFEVLYSVGDPFDTTWYPKSTEKKFFTINYTYIVPPSANPDDVITIKVTATDVDGKAKLNTFILTVKDLSGLKVYNDIILGAQANATYGSFYASSTNTVYNINSAKVQGQTTVDFIYYYGNVKTATLAAPAFADFGTGSGDRKSVV